ncbi:MAG: hypothetical protein ACI4S2_04185 [Lachnospiraceae bacterium]
MNKKVTQTKGWFYLAIGCIVISLLSLFLPIFESYGFTFNIIDLISGSEDFTFFVIEGYTGPVIWNITTGTVVALAIIAVVALICAILGLITLKAQRPNTKNFILTIIGLVGILIPSITAIICVVGFGQYYSGGLRLGIAPIISPIAIMVSIAAVIRRKNKVAEEMEKEVKEKGLIWKAGDL